MLEENQISTGQSISQKWLDSPYEKNATRRKHTHCMYCHKELTGRSDQKFCSPACRYAYNNQIKACRRKEMKAVIGLMEENERFLHLLYLKDPHGVWPKDMLDHPSFHGDARSILIRHPDSPDPGNKFFHYSVHVNHTKNTFTILYHDDCSV